MKSRLTNVEMRREEDVTFVEDQIKTRKGKFQTADSIYDSKINAKKVREEKYDPKTPKSRKIFIDRPAEVTPRVHSSLDIGVICFILWTGPDLKIAPFERVLKNLLDTGPWD